MKCLNLHGRLAQLLRVGEPFDELSGIKSMNEAELDLVVAKFCADAGQALKEAWRKLNESQSEVIEPLQVALGKFMGTVGKFGDTGMFQEGLENQLGNPDPLMLKGLFRENVLADSSNLRALTSNYKIIFSTLQEYEYIDNWSQQNTKLKKVDWERNRNIPLFLVEIAKGKHPGIKGPREAELKDLEETFGTLRKYYKTICKANCGMFPGDVGYINKSMLIEVEAKDKNSANKFYEEIVKREKELTAHDDPLIVAGDSAPSQNKFKFMVYAPLPFFTEHRDKHLTEEFAAFDSSMSLKSSFQTMIYCKLDVNDKEKMLLELLDAFSIPELIQILGKNEEAQGVIFDSSSYANSIVKEALKPDSTQIILIQGRRPLSLRILMDTKVVKEGSLSIQEAIQAYQYTGPLFQVLTHFFWHFRQIQCLITGF